MSQEPLSYESAKEAADIWAKAGYSKKEAAKLLGISSSTFCNRLNVAVRLKIIEHSSTNKILIKHEHVPRQAISIPDGVVIVGSDAHYWPGNLSTAHKALLKMIKELQPKLVVMNGDVLDGAGVSRHPPIGWESHPDLTDEIEECKTRLMEIEDAAGKKCKKIWTLGNHDARFETRLATVAPQYARIHGIHLKDHFPAWDTGWSVWVNDEVVIKHRWKGGVHATHNNTVNAGKSFVTGHLHSLKVTPYTDYNGTRYGIDTGTLAPIYDRETVSNQFLAYTEDSPVNWRSGFMVLTFHKGELLWPEVVRVIDQKRFEFRGKVYTV